MNSGTNFAGLVQDILGLANTLIPVLIGLALIAFFIGLIRYIRKTGESSSALADGRQLIQWGLIAMFCLVCIWGIVAFISSALLGT